MARTWSNAKRVDDGLSAAQREKNRPKSATVFMGLMIFVTVLFGLIMAYTTIRMVSHPATEVIQPTNQDPKDD